MTRLESDRLNVVVFQIIPCSQEIRDYVNEVSSSLIYNSFNEENSDELLTATLERVCNSEYNTYKLLNNINNGLKYSWIIQDAQKICNTVTDYKLPITSNIALNDVYKRDQNLFSNIGTEIIYAFVLTINNIYSGHVYAWGVDNVLNVIGIRSSITQMLLRSCDKNFKGIGKILIDAVKNYALEFSYIRVLHPILAMPHILRSLGFVKLSELIQINPNEYMWLTHNYTIGNTRLTHSNPGTRTYDYVLSL